MNARERALQPGDHELAWRIVAEPVTRAAANDGIDRGHIQADGRVTSRPQRRETKVVVHTAVRKGDAFDPSAAIVAVEGKLFIERGQKQRVSRGGGYCMRQRNAGLSEPPQSPGPGFPGREIER